MEKNLQFHPLALGRHLTVEYYDCDAGVLADCARMEALFVAAAQKSGATVLESSFHNFEPQGVSGVVIISESHFAVHAWPEHDYAAVDIFTCGDAIDFELAVAHIQEDLRSKQAIVSGVLSRGIVGGDALIRSIPVDYHSEIQQYERSFHREFESSDAWGMTANIDLYQCREEVVSSEAKLAEMLQNLCSYLNMGTTRACRSDNFYHASKGNGVMLRAISDSGEATVRANFSNNRLYCDITSFAFFEPRDAAELLMKAVGGKYYRIQVAVRH